MVRNLKSLATSSDDNALVEAIRSSAHQIWQAGLGAFAAAREEGGDVFTKLVQEGTRLQKRTQRLVGGKDFGLTDSVTKLAENVGRQATGSWEKLETVFEDRVSRSLRSLGVPTQDDIKGLSRQIDELNRSIIALAAKKEAPVRTVKKTAEKAAPKKRVEKAATKLPVKTAVKSAAMKRAVSAAAKKRAGPAVNQV